MDSLKKLRMALSALMGDCYMLYNKALCLSKEIHNFFAAVTVMEIVEIIAVIVGWVGMVMTVEQLLPREAIILFQF